MFLENAFRKEGENSNITYAELFEYVDNAVSEIEKNKFEIQSIREEYVNSELMLEYLVNCQNVLRAFRTKYNAALASSVAEDWAKERRQDFLDSENDYSYKYEAKAYKKALEDNVEKLEKLKESIAEYAKRMKDLSDNYEKYAQEIPIEYLIPKSMLESKIKSSI